MNQDESKLELLHFPETTVLPGNSKV